MEIDWLRVCREASAGVLAALGRHPLPEDRRREVGRGKGGDMSLAIDRAAEDAVFERLEQLGAGLTVVSEERGHVELGGGGPPYVVVDPIDGSRNARRDAYPYALSVAVAAGGRMPDVHFAYVRELRHGEEFWAVTGQGAFAGGRRLSAADGPEGIELIGLESTDPVLLREAAGRLAATGANRVRAFGSVALTLCFVACGRLDAMLVLGPTRSVDAAAGQLIVREAGGSVTFAPDRGPFLDVSLDLDMRAPVAAATSRALLESLR